VLGALSAALIILLTALLVMVKRVSGNRITEIVEMKRLAPQGKVRDRTGDHHGDDNFSTVDEFSSGCADDDVIYNNDEILEIDDDPTYND
jgi:hypothetical protein